MHLRPTASQTQSPMMIQSYPGPNILQPQKITDASSLASRDSDMNSKPIDKEFLAELEKNLGLVEASANLMPSPSKATAAATPTAVTEVPRPTRGISTKKAQVPALLPPPQSSARSSNRRLQYSTPPPTEPVKPMTRRDNSLPRKMNHIEPESNSAAASAARKMNHENNGRLRVALPDEHQPKGPKASTTVAHVKPFLSPNSKQQARMGDVAAARGNWRPLSLGTGNGSKDFLADQRKQLAEIERLRESAQSNLNRNVRSQSVLPPSGAGRPTNHLEVNKMAQVYI